MCLTGKYYNVLKIVLKNATEKGCKCQLVGAELHLVTEPFNLFAMLC